MGKIGRNDPCPCGSGKKFKKCCLGSPRKKLVTEETETKTPKSKFLAYVEKHEAGHIFNMITALQLIPENHGKNYRIEVMAREAVRNFGDGTGGNWKKLSSLIVDEFPRHHMEDPPEALFTENVISHGGNYVVMPGINVNSTEIFKYISETIFTSNEESFEDEFKDQIYQGVAFMLDIGSILFSTVSLEGNLFVENTSESLKIPSEVKRLGFDQDEITLICANSDISPKIIEHFITAQDAPEFKYRDVSLSPLLFRPFVQYKNEYFLLLPTAQMSAINEYIFKISKQFEVRDKIHELCHERIWQDVWGACDKMNWVLTDISLPDLPIDVCLKERVFQFDAFTLAYVCYIYSDDLLGTYEMYESRRMDLLNGSFLNKRNEAVITELKSRKELEDYQFLTVILTNAMGGFSALAINEPQEGEQKVWLGVFDFLTLANAGEWNRLGLWKYAKVYASTSKESQIFVTSPIDAYSTYKRNGETFYLSDESRFDFLTVVPGDGAEFVRKAKIKTDTRGVLCMVNGSVVYRPVKRSKQFAPIYKPLLPIIHYESVLRVYKFPIWIQNFQAKSRAEAGQVENIAEAIAFWLYKLYPTLDDSIDNIDLDLLHIILEFDTSYFSPIPLEAMPPKKSLNLELECLYSDNILVYKFPKDIHTHFIGGDNLGERNMMMKILQGLNQIPQVNLSDQKIKESVDLQIPLGPAKMILFIDTRTDLQLDNRWLLPTLYISEAEINLLLDRLTKIIDSPTPIPEKFDNIPDKKRFCNKVVLNLAQYLIQKLKDFDGLTLLDRLMEINERLVHNREFSKIRTAAQIHCFGHDSEELEKILKEEKNLVNTSLSTRCLIEFMVFIPPSGKRKPSLDELDELLVIMNEILNYGMLSDAIHFGMADPNIGLLKSGRIGISKEFYDEKLQPFFKDNTMASIESYLEDFSNQFGLYGDKQVTVENDAFFNKVDDAFLEDWGIDLTNLNTICIQAARIAENKGSSVVSMLEDDLVRELKGIMVGAEDQVLIGLEKLRLEYKTDVISAESGYINSDYFPWKYNRDFSYARRPFVCVDTEEGRKYFWGMRQSIASSQFLTQLLFTARLTHGGAKINSILGEISEENGKNFRNSVADWLKNNTSLQVWDYEVTMKPGGHFDADKNYGDCDIVAHDKPSNTVFNIECKRTYPARNVHQMKMEMDAYLGRAGQTKKIAKHLARDSWLQLNLDKVKDWVGVTEQPTVKSLIVTSELLPTRYLKSEAVDLPIVSYRELRKSGIEALN